MNKYEEITNIIKNKMGEDYVITYHEVIKNNNVILHGVLIRKISETVAPTVYIDSFMEMTAEQAAENVIKIYRQSNNDLCTKELEMISKIGNFSDVKSLLSIRLINKESNKAILGIDQREIPYISCESFLNFIPYESFLDLAVIITINFSDDNTVTTKVNNRMLKMWDISFEKALSIAKDNFYSKGSYFVSMEKMLADMGFPVFGNIDIYVLTNTVKFFGAGIITNSEVMDDLCDTLISDLIVIPSSIHEVIVLPFTGEFKIDNITKMIIDVNTSEVDPEEVLSDHPYFYRKKIGWRRISY